MSSIARARVATAAPAASPLAAFAADVRAGLTATPKTLPSQYLYDALGSALFDAICRLSWYEVTRAEQRLLERHARAIRERADPALIVELGPGSGEKLATFARPAPQAGSAPATHDATLNGGLRVHLIDISPAALDLASRTLGQVPGLRVTTSRATYDEGLLDIARVRPPFGRATVLFLGSNIGNFDPPRAHALLHGIHQALRPGDTLLLGLDLVKPEPVLQLAYDDPLGVTAAFNRNLLARMNRELGASFDLARFEHQVIWRADCSRIEMHLVSRGAQTVRIPGADLTIALADQETIWTESSYKYEISDAEHLGRTAGFRLRDQWIDEPGRFALTLFEA